tara:strand:- start:928 stop:3021 length:2094 start_codon:yes stop_codon:yes gene_type:complete
MSISILLPYKEDYTKNKAGAVSIFLYGQQKVSNYKNSIKIFGTTIYKDKLSKNYVEIPFKKNILQSSSKEYVKSFIKIEKKYKSKIIEIHNRPEYLKYFNIYEGKKYILYFHNDPLQMKGSASTNDRLFLLNKCEYIVFNSNWTKNRFLHKLNKFYSSSPKLIVIEQSINKVKINFKKKEKIIIFVGKLNSSKGYDIFGNAVIKILNKFPLWKAVVIGDEPREKINFYHKRLLLLGHKNHNFVLNYLKKSSISVTPSKWEEPFGRSSLEASSRGCAVIVSNKGGLPETVTDGIILNKLTSSNLRKNIEYLIMNPKKIINYQRKSHKNFYLTDKYIASKIDQYRRAILSKKINLDIRCKRILHVTNFNERHNGRLFYNTGRRLNNGFVRLKHSVLTLSDRDTISSQRSLIDISGSRSLNNKLLEVVGNFKPDIIFFGHADLVSRESVIKIRNIYPNIKMSQWFLDKMDNINWKVNKKRFEKIKDLLDCSFCTTYPESKSLNTYFIPNPVDPTFENLKVFKKRTYKYDVFFAMSHGVHRGVLKYGKFDERETFLNNLIKKLPDIKFDLYGLNNNQPIWAENYKEKLNQSPMAINLSQGISQKYYSSDRIAQLIGNGLLTFVDKKTKLSDFFTNNEVIFYNSINDLAKKIIKYKNNVNLRNKISQNGYKAYHSKMSSDKVADYMIKRTMGFKNIKKFIFS